jgi:DnaJ-class molecular chaperone
MVSSDHYQILGVSNDASTRKITSAYRKLALRYHPDRNKSPQANEMMLKINTAYGILSDPHKREQYDYSIGISKAVLRQKSRNKSSGNNVHQRLFPLLFSVARILVFNSLRTIKFIIKFVSDRIN